MLLQLALDLCSSDEGIDVVNQVRDYIDIIEVGTPIMYREGENAVRKMADAFPEKKILADLKIMDAGEIEATDAFEAGADIVTVLGLADDSTIQGAIRAAKKFGGEILIDMINVPDIKLRGKELNKLGADYLCIHTGTDMQSFGADPFDSLKELSEVANNIAVAGGINLGTVEKATQLSPKIIIVGGGITSKDDKTSEAMLIKRIMEDAE